MTIRLAFLSATIATVLGTIAAVREAGLRIPEDVAVIGFGGFEWGHYVTPALTTVSLDVATMARRIREAFEACEAGDAIPPLTLIQTSLVVRQSS